MAHIIWCCFWVFFQHLSVFGSIHACVSSEVNLSLLLSCTSKGDAWYCTTGKNSFMLSDSRYTSPEVVMLCCCAGQGSPWSWAVFNFPILNSVHRNFPLGGVHALKLLNLWDVNCTSSSLSHVVTQSALFYGLVTVYKWYFPVLQWRAK